MVMRKRRLRAKRVKMNKKTYALRWELVSSMPNETRAAPPGTLRAPECACCERGATSITPNGTRAPPRPLLRVSVKPKFSVDADAVGNALHLVCFACAMNELGVHSDVIAAARVAYRRSYNEQHFAHLLEPARLAMDLRIAPPCVRRFMQCVDAGEAIPPRVLQAVVDWKQRTTEGTPAKTRIQ